MSDNKTNKRSRPRAVVSRPASAHKSAPRRVVSQKPTVSTTASLHKPAQRPAARTTAHAQKPAASASRPTQKPTGKTASAQPKKTSAAPVKSSAQKNGGSARPTAVSRPTQTPSRADSAHENGMSATHSDKNVNNGGKRRSKKTAVVAVIIAVIIAVGAAVGIVLGVRACGKNDSGGNTVPPVEGLQDISYVETLDYVANPDQGFYRPAFVKLTASGATCGKPLYAETQLYHLRVDISAFSTAAGGSDGEITQAALDGLDEVISFYEERGRNVIVRFAYDPGYGGKSNTEPSLETMLGHIRALSAVLGAHKDAVTAIETGMVGPWGEMHTSSAASIENITQLATEFLNNVADTPVLVRTPRMIYACLGVGLDELDGYTVPAGSSLSRLGLYNDGYLGSDSDLGTYTNRAVETAWLGQNVTDHLPYGGEVVVPDSRLHDINSCTAEMFSMHLSYLNYEWNNNVVQNKWVNSKYTKASGGDKRYYGQSAYTYIRNRLGYRLIVRQSVFKESADGKLGVTLSIENVGFGNMNRTKQARILFVNDGGDVISSVSVGEYDGGSSLAADVALPSAAGNYDVYVMLSGDGAPAYPVAFANEGMYDAELRANKVGSIEVKSKSE